MPSTVSHSRMTKEIRLPEEETNGTFPSWVASQVGSLDGPIRTSPGDLMTTLVPRCLESLRQKKSLRYQVSLRGPSIMLPRNDQAGLPFWEHVQFY